MEWRSDRTVAVQRRHVPVGGGGAWIEVVVGGDAAGGVVAAAHPMVSLGAEPLALLAGVTGARVLAFNARGLGGASRVASGDDTSLERMVEDFEEARLALGAPRWLWWGMSAGGYLGQLYAHRHPEAFVGLLLDSTAPCFREAVLDSRSVLSPEHPRWREPLGCAGLLGAVDDALVEDRRLVWLEVEGVGRVLRLVGGPALLVAPIDPPPGMKRGVAALWRFDARPYLATIRVPTLVLAGPEDPIVPLAHQRALHAAIPGAELLEPPGAGHTPVSVQPDAIAAAVRPFVRRVLAST
ncbi:MAG: alpha/beta hydrolase [Deltaproteobacteria bacterium]|nr:alpha/beta hydrolase [Deltaproteobacteria bacterium]